MKMALILMAGVMLAGCAEGRFTGGKTCMPDGSVVWYQYKNTSGTYEGAKSHAKYCK